MYKTSVTFENFEGEKVTKDLYFNLTKAEIAKIQLSHKGGFDKYVESIIHPEDGEPDSNKIIELIETLILKAYGVRTEEGFIKTPEKAQAFLSTEAYSELFMRLLSDEKAQTEFFMNIIPKDLAAQAQAEIEKNEAKILPGPGSSAN